jgi:hypothetical protein
MLLDNDGFWPFRLAPCTRSRYLLHSAQTLARDIAELSACMRPMDVSSLRQRGDERFKQKDYPGAVEAYSLLLQVREAVSHPAARFLS